MSNGDGAIGFRWWKCHVCYSQGPGELDHSRHGEGVCAFAHDDALNEACGVAMWAGMMEAHAERLGGELIRLAVEARAERYEAFHKGMLDLVAEAQREVTTREP
jgi:hypothetical protein